MTTSSSASDENFIEMATFFSMEYIAVISDISDLQNIVITDISDTSSQLIPLCSSFHVLFL